MNTPLIDWTVERVTRIAPDEQVAKSGRRLSDVSDAAWQVVGQGDDSVWGEYQVGDEEKIICKIDLLKLRHDEQHWHCTCGARHKPCKHILALLYCFIENAKELPLRDVPDYVTSWWDKTSRNEIKKAANKWSEDDLTPEQQAEFEAQYAARKERITAGLADLEQWMITMIQHGLANPQVQTYDYWDSRAARLVDAQASGIAAWLRDMGGLAVSGSDWMEPLLYQLGRLYLLIESFKRFDNLPLETQADIRTVLGWPLKLHEVPQDESVVDDWLVIGRFTYEMHERKRTRRIWLRGRETGRDALIEERVFGDTLFVTHLKLGWSLRARMIFYPSRYPLRAFIGERLGDVTQGKVMDGQTIQESIERYSAALSQNPWLANFPFLLDKVVTIQYNKGWILREVDGTYLPISRRFQDKYWALMALSGGSPIQVAGEWDGEAFYPTGACVDDRFVEFEEIGKI